MLTTEEITRFSECDDDEPNGEMERERTTLADAREIAEYIDGPCFVAYDDSGASDESPEDERYYVFRLSEQKIHADWNDVLDGAAHIPLAHTCLRASIPAYFSDDPDADSDIHVDSYPNPGMPDHHEVMRIPVPEGAIDAEILKAAIREKYGEVHPEMDEA